MKETLYKRLKELKRNSNTLKVRVAGITTSGVLFTGTITAIRQDHIILTELTTGSKHMIPLDRIRTLEC